MSKSGTNISLRAALSSSPNNAEKMRVMGLKISVRNFSGVLGNGGDQRRGN